MDIVKASGEREKFDKEKIYQSLKNAGATPRLAAEICQKVVRNITDGMSSQEVFGQILLFLQKQNSILAARYNLKNAIMELGPAGFTFEQFVADILQEYGYATRVGQKVEGSCAGKECVVHEVDVVAQKGKENFMVECKYHNQRGLQSDLKVALYTYARFLDIKTAYSFFGAWLITNTKCTTQATIFAKCKGLKIISWRYPEKEGLNDLIEEKALYPITILPSLSDFAKEKLYREKIVLAKDLLKYTHNDLSDGFGIDPRLAKKLREELNGLFSVEV